MASLKSKQPNLLFQGLYAYGQRIPAFLLKIKCKLYGGVDDLSFGILIWFCFSQLSLVGSILLPFGTWHSSIWKCIYSGKGTKDKITAGILKNFVSHLLLHSQYPLFFKDPASTKLSRSSHSS